ncbi:MULTISPECIES: hypothetical protein [unclassified Nonomuraea]|uniref:hypothetical protein n=1 Tax=unclassified Nonomuraea TaxID=2593643 RepID=UPI0033C92DFE
MSALSRHRKVRAARERLASRFGDEATKRLAAKFAYELPAVEAVTKVADVIRLPDRDETVDPWPVPTPEDVDDALLAVSGARVQLLVDEETLIQAALANGRSWVQIGKMLGLSEAVAEARPEAIRRAIADLTQRDPGSITWR